MHEYGRHYGMVYHPGIRAEVPMDLKDKSVSHRLVPIHDTLRQHRDQIGPGLAFDQPSNHRGRILAAAFCSLLHQT
jgi:hypothetical protein